MCCWFLFFDLFSNLLFLSSFVRFNRIKPIANTVFDCFKQYIGIDEHIFGFINWFIFLIDEFLEILVESLKEASHHLVLPCKFKYFFDITDHFLQIKILELIILYTLIPELSIQFFHDKTVISLSVQLKSYLFFGVHNLLFLCHNPISQIPNIFNIS